MHVCVHTHVSDREVTYTRVCVAFSLAQMPDSRSMFWHFSRIPACRESPAAPELLRLNPASDSWGPPAFPAPRAEPASGFRARVSPSWGAHGRAVCLLTFTDVSCAPPFPPTHTPEFSKILMSVTPPSGACPGWWCPHGELRSQVEGPGAPRRWGHPGPEQPQVSGGCGSQKRQPVAEA